MIWAVLVLASVGAGWMFGHGDVSLNARAAAETSAPDLLTALLGVTGGWYGRERVRLRRAYASPTLSYLGKALFFASLSPAAAGAFSPVSWPAPWIHLFAAGCAAGAGIWLANLPSRL